MLEGSPSVLVVGDDEVARGEVTVDSGLSLTIRLDEILGEIPAIGDDVLVRTLEEVRGRREYMATVEAWRAGHVVVTNIELVSAFQQRAIVRVGTDIPITIVYETDGDDLRDLATPIQASILDLSATGLRIHCSVPLQDSFRFGFHLSTDFDDLTLVAEVLRREDAPRGYRYGCKLVGTTQREADALHRYVLSEQIAQRRRGFQD
ncbi:PilZ domain-containing protein [Cellulomonas fimi]|uniref:PilZ domain-containing protein n=1 Tax=Cellulomonas fimi TaxID=1708 RepID=A0A7Y0M167_CELFI|nr:PilZ domain-containing protein [Cellulomonas fimi]NMR21544.1 PilZ domain-containing protein [Cellulomonas fimi]